MHRSRLGAIVIDCNAADLADAAAFWSCALGQDFEIGPDGKYAVGDGPAAGPKVLLQHVEHDSRVHIDIETDDKEAEAARLEGLGARRIGAVKRWIVMEAPTGHRFCVVNPQRTDFPGDATVWED